MKPSPLQKIFSENLNYFIGASDKWTKTSIGRAIGVAPAQITHWVSGGVWPKMSRVEALSDCLEVPVCKLFEKPKKPDGSINEVDLLRLIKSLGFEAPKRLIRTLKN